MAQKWYNKWRDSRDLKACPVTWEIFKKAFLERIFASDKRESNVEELINFYQIGMSVLY